MALPDAALYVLVLAAAVALLWFLRRERFQEGTCPGPMEWYDPKTRGCRGPQLCRDLGGALVVDAQGRTRCQF